MAGRVVQFRIDGQPLPKERARSGRFSTRHVTPAQTRVFEQGVGWQALPHFRGDLLQGDLRAQMTFYRETFVRADVTNLAKAIEDGLQGVAYANDNQIVEEHLRVYYGQADPHTLVILEELDADL